MRLDERAHLGEGVGLAGSEEEADEALNVLWLKEVRELLDLCYITRHPDEQLIDRGRLIRDALDQVVQQPMAFPQVSA